MNRTTENREGALTMKAVYAAGTDYDNPLSQLKVGELDTPPKPNRRSGTG